MSGMASGIRAAMFDKKVLILEQHSIAGGLNSYYQRGKRNFDVGLHALTNFIKKGEKGRPFNKLLKQLRIPYDAFNLKEQSHSKIIFPQRELTFTNDFSYLTAEIREKFPKQIDSFIKLVERVDGYDQFSLKGEYRSTREVLSSFFDDELLIEMLLCPLMIYGSAWEDDMDFSQFVIMFKSIFQEGFSRPLNGVRTIIDLLVNKYKEQGGEIIFKSPVYRIVTNHNKVQEVILKNGEVIQTDSIISSAGLPETVKLISGGIANFAPRAGNMSFVETIMVYDKKIPKDLFDTTIIFGNERKTYHYRKPDELIDEKSAVVCCPDNYHDHHGSGDSVVRVTNIANFELWGKLSGKEYIDAKEEVLKSAQRIAKKYLPNYDRELMFHDVFTPVTIKRFTGHLNGVVYGSIDKSKDGTTPYDGLYICGTDQGFLGIVGSILSGISMTNLHILSKN